MRYQTALHSDNSGGDEWDRTTDLMRMKQLLYLLSYITENLVPQERLELSRLRTGF